MCSSDFHASVSIGLSQHRKRTFLLTQTAADLKGISFSFTSSGSFPEKNEYSMNTNKYPVAIFGDFVV